MHWRCGERPGAHTYRLTQYFMQALATLLPLLFCAVTLTPQKALAARMPPPCQPPVQLRWKLWLALLFAPGMARLTSWHKLREPLGGRS